MPEASFPSLRTIRGAVKGVNPWGLKVEVQWLAYPDPRQHSCWMKYLGGRSRASHRRKPDSRDTPRGKRRDAGAP
jgi:hypothetical protein